MRLMFVVPTMGRGGAEIQLKRLAAGMAMRGHAVHVNVLMPVEDFGNEIRSSGVELGSLEMRRGVPSVGALRELARRVRAWSPDVIQTWMYSADVIGGLVARLCRVPVAWAIRGSAIHRSKRRSRATMRAAAALSHAVPRRIFANSERGRQVHVAAGYRADIIRVIPNGFDTTLFRRRPDLRAKLRAELGIPASSPVVGIVARFDPHKDHRTFFRAAGVLRRRWPDVRFVAVGKGIPESDDIERWVREADLGGACVLLGQRADLVALYNAFDVAVLTSVAEGFPNVLGEAMACEVPCVATDVGDAAEIIDSTGRIAPVGGADEIADAVGSILEMPAAGRLEFGARARQRILSQYDAESIASAYEAEWLRLAEAS